MLKCEENSGRELARGAWFHYQTQGYRSPAARVQFSSTPSVARCYVNQASTLIDLTVAESFLDFACNFLWSNRMIIVNDRVRCRINGILSKRHDPPDCFEIF